MSSPRLRPLVLSMLLLGSVPSNSAADPIGLVDQEVNPLDPSIGISSVGYLFCCHLLAQSFTSGLSGQLSAVQVLVAQGTNASVAGGVTGIGFNLWRMAGDTITGQPLATVLLPQTAVPQDPGFVTADLLDQGVFLQAGEQLAFTLHTTSPHPTGYTWFGNSSDLYSGGASGLLFGELQEPLNFSADFGFRTFVVEDSAAPIPEPASMWLVATGAALLIRRARRGNCAVRGPGPLF